MPAKQPSRQQKELVKKRAHWRCEYCLCPASFSPFTFHVDHILPFGKGGQTELDNLAFSWSEDARTITGLTSIGRATVEALRMNRDELINLRKLMFAAGEHPPTD